MSISKTKILLLESKKNLRMATMFALESRFNFHVLDCNTIKSAEMLLEVNSDVQAIIFAGAVEGESTENFFLSNKAKFNDIPMICTDDDICDHWGQIPEMKFSKDKIVSDMLDTIEVQFEIDPEAPVEKYTPVSLKALSFADSLAEDAYVKLGSGRLIKLFSIGDKIENEDVERYKRKGVEQLYLDRKACKWILKAVNQDIERMIEDENFTLDLANSPLMDDSKDARDLFGELADDEYVENVFHQEEEFIQNVYMQTNVVVNNIRQNKDLMKMLAKIRFDKGEGAFVKNRMKLVSALSCSIARNMGWDSDQTYEKLIYAAHIHDIMLIDSPNMAKFKYLSEADTAMELGKITDRDRDRFLKHTIHASELVKFDPHAPPDVPTIILQHHEMPHGDGFPSKMSGIRINAFAAILNVSIDLAQFLLLNKSKDFAKYIENNKSKYKGGPFTKVMKSIAELTGNKF